MSDPIRERVAWFLWCADQGYIKAEDRAVLTNWFLDDLSTLHPDDLADRNGWLSMADEVIAAIHSDDATIIVPRSFVESVLYSGSFDQENS